MTASPLATAPLLHLGPLSITEPVLATWAIIILMTAVSAWLTRNLSLTPGKVQTVLELLVETIDQQIRDTMQTGPATYRALIGTLFLLPVILVYTAWSYWVFRGKIDPAGGYH